ncbi:MAG: molybdopterin synthase sulfur carrier subunit [Verrucomicrobiaceae bacterium]|nr:molybdopterin synthase sulfur carrier subunit [Verrucomicrobiaceae bacterium]
MKLRLLFFSVLRDLTGTAELELTCEAATVRGLLGVLYERWPALAAWDASLLIAVDQTYARRDDPLHDGAEVALMPPVQGG